MDRAVKRGKLNAADRDSALGQITLTGELTDVADTDLLIEAVPENVDPEDLTHEDARQHRQRPRPDRVVHLGYPDRAN